MRWIAAIAALGVESCSIEGVEPYSPSSVGSEMVTGAALAALGPDGRFNLRLPASRPGQLPLSVARTRALQYARLVTDSALILASLAADRGGSVVETHLLSQCHEDYYVRPQTEPLPLDTFPPNVQQSLGRAFGPGWLVALCNPRGTPEMTVQVAIDGNASVLTDSQPETLLSRFAGRGVPEGTPGVLPVSAERAVRHAFAQLGVRVSEVPEPYARGSALNQALYIVAAKSARVCNRWRILLEREVAVRGVTSKANRSAREVFVGSATCGPLDLNPRLQVPLPFQPEGTFIEFFVPGPGGSATVRLPLSYASPVYMEFAELVR